MMVAVLTLPMSLAAGGALDLVAQERARVRLQDTLDRGVLAAAALDQTQDSKALVASYLKNIPGIATASVTVTDQKQLAFRKVTGTVSMPYSTVFLRIAGIKQLNVVAKSTAQEARQNIELSMVLDISGSMLDNGGMTQLIPAAKSFLDVILGSASSRKVTSVSIVPFAGGVNIGEKPFNYLVSSVLYTRRHNKSSCFELLSADFDAGTPVWTKADQFPHYSINNMTSKGKQPWWCPTDDAAVTYLTNDLAALKARIDALKPYDGTGTAYGMKWGELLLNPSMAATIKSMAESGAISIPEDFKGRPSAFKDGQTLKFIVLMTDGQIGPQPRPISPTTNEVTDKNIPTAERRTLYNETQSAAFYKKVCDYAKKQEIVIFTIAFKVSDAVAANIATCATNPSYAYKVDGLDMASAFNSIATTIKKIRITE
ncbi:pilus assembly protein TadG-related protein [Rhizobium sp.]